jgi:hypothetical protein
MRESAVRELLSKAKEGWTVVEKLLIEDKLVETKYSSHRYYMRKWI